MTTLTEGKRAGEFLVSEANGTRSRRTGTLLSGQDLQAGTVICSQGGKLRALPGDLDSNGGLEAAAIGILWDNVDASGGDVTGVVYIGSDAEVNGEELVYPPETTNGGEEALTNASLALLNIIVR